MSTDRHLIWNPVMNTSISLNDSEYLTYQRMLRTDPKLYPYQSLDMRKKGTVRYATKEQIQKHMAERDMYNAARISSVCPFDLISNINIFKTKSYLYQLDPVVRAFQPILAAVVNQTCHDPNYDAKYIFVPYIPETSILTIDPHNTYEQIDIVNNKLFMSHLKDTISADQLGPLLYKLNDLFGQYNNMLTYLSLVYGEDVTRENLIDIIVKIHREMLYGLNKKVIASRLRARQDLITYWIENAATDCDIDHIDQLYQQYYTQALKSDYVQQSPIYNEIKKCYAGVLNLKSISVDQIKDIVSDEALYALCTGMKFSPDDTFDSASMQPECVKLIDDARIRQNLLRYVKPARASACPWLLSTTAPAVMPEIEYMPEWYDLVWRGDVNAAFDHRQLLLGDMKITSFFKRCSLVYRADPFISRSCDLPGLVQDTELNKLIVSCVAGSSDVFPIRVLNCNELTDSSRIYEHFDRTEKDMLLGAILIKMRGVRTNHQPRFYVLYVYYNPDRRFNLTIVDFKGNIIIPGTIIEYVRTLYVEMNTLMYAKSDIGINLHAYQLNHTNGFDILFSRYSLKEIHSIYSKIESLRDRANTIISRLQEVRITKDQNKRFRFVPLKQTGGGDDAIDDAGIVYRFDCPDYHWDIKFSANHTVIDDAVYSVNFSNILNSSLKHFSKVMSEQVFEQACTPSSYYKFVSTPSIGAYTKDKLKTATKSTRHKKIYAKQLASVTEPDIILAYTFENAIAFYVYTVIRKFIEVGSHYVIWSKNQSCLDGLVYYLKYDKFAFDPAAIEMNLFAYRYSISDSTMDYLDANKISYRLIDQPLNNSTLDTVSDQKVDFGIIDLVINIPSLETVRNLYMFQTWYSALVQTMSRLNTGGSLMINTSLIPTKMVYNFVAYLSCAFHSTFIYEYPDAELSVASQLVISFVTLKDYRGSIDIAKLSDLNAKLYQFDPTGGFRFDIDAATKAELHLKYAATDPAKQFLTQIIDMPAGPFYHKYKAYAKSRIFRIIENYESRYVLYQKRSDKPYLLDACKLAKTKAIMYAQKYHFPLLDWIEQKPAEYFHRVINTRFATPYTKIAKFPKSDLKLELSEDILIVGFDSVKRNYQLLELTYQYIDKINHQKYAKGELFINREYKKLNRTLYEDFDVNINGKPVSRAWIKMYELLHDLDFLKKFPEDELKVFYICEAPGNFVNAMDYYIKHQTAIKTHTFVAQSLAANLAQFYDTYGFIAKTRNQWDLGPERSGDIMSSQNQRYYLETYANVDILVGDCGEKWTVDPTEKDLSAHELIYAILIPKVGGNFIIKTFTTNHNKLYLALLYVACSVYDQVFAFKSNMNIWSPEIYICGIGKRELTDEETDTLLEVSKSASTGKTLYPVSVIPEDFASAYADIMYSFLSTTIDIKKLFVFLVDNEDVFDKEAIQQIISKKNKGWIEKYIR